MQPEPHRNSAQYRVLVIQTAFLGDVLLSVPLLRNIRQLYPKAELIYICREGLGALLKELKLVDQYREVKKNQQSSYSKIIEEFQGTVFDRIYCPHESLRSALLVHKINAKKKIGFKNWWNFIFFNVRTERNKNLPEALRQLQMLSADSDELHRKIINYSNQYQAGDLGDVPDWASMNLSNVLQNNATDETSTKHLNPMDSKKIVCLFPGSVWKTKQWTLGGFIEVAKKLSDEHTVYLMGGKEEVQLGVQIQNAVPRVVNQIGKLALMETLQVLLRADVVVTNDSGGQHLAALAGVPTVSIFGPTVLNFGYRPWNQQVKVVQNMSISCRPCGKHGHRSCPIGTHDCMTSIQSQKVLNAVQELFSIT